MPADSLTTRWLKLKRRKLRGEGTSAESGSRAAHPAAHMTATNFLALDDFEVIPSPPAPVNPSITPTEKLSVDAPTTGSDSAPVPIIPEFIAERFVPISLAMASPVNVPHPDEPIYPGSSAEPSSSRIEEPSPPSQLHFVQGSPLAPFLISDVRRRGPLLNPTANLSDQVPSRSLGLPEPQYRTNPADMAEFRKMPFSAQLGHLQNSFYSFVARGQYLLETTNEKIEEYQAGSAEAQREKEELTRSIKELAATVEQLRQELELTRSVNDLEQLQAIIKKFYSDKKSLQESLQRVSELQEKQQGAFEECQARLAEVQREKEELTRSVNELEQEKKELAATVERLRQ